MATRAGKAIVRTNKEQHTEVQLPMNLKDKSMMQCSHSLTRAVWQDMMAR